MCHCHATPTQPPRGRWLVALVALLLAGLFSAACGTTLPTTQQVRLTLASSSSALPLAGDLAAAYQQAFPHVTVDVLAFANEAAAERALQAGQVDAALVGGPAPSIEGIENSHVADDALALVVNPTRNLDNLTSQQVQEVLRGRLRTWDELNAGSGVIHVVTREPGSGPRQALLAAFLGAGQLTPTAVILPDDRQVLARVAADPNALAALPAAWLDAQVKAVTLDGRGPEWVARQWPDYPAVLPIHLLVAREPSPEVAALRSFLLGARGQRIVSQRYAPAMSQP